MSKSLLDEIIPDDIEEHLQDEHYHHYLCGCECIMLPISATHYQGEGIGVYKKCLTHNVDCSKTGWELGYYLGNKNKGTKEISYICECGKYYKNKYGMCFNCLKEKKPETYNEYYTAYKLQQAKANIKVKMKYLGIPKDKWAEKLKDYEENYYNKFGTSPRLNNFLNN